jgi:hypothetical protein
MKFFNTFKIERLVKYALLTHLTLKGADGRNNSFFFFFDNMEETIVMFILFCKLNEGRNK